jgi:2-(1,2-epoxy-1,2-dihydrophenyl)acetyl-CoA isomerase
VAEVVEADELLACALARAQALAAMPGRAIGLTKVLLNAALTNTLAVQLELEADFQQLAVADPGRMAARARVAQQLDKAQSSDLPARSAISADRDT